MELAFILHTCESADSEIAAICKDYWAQDELGKFTSRVTDIARKYGLFSPYQVTEIVKLNSKATFPSGRCKTCGGPLAIFRSRAQATEAMRQLRRELCENCEEQARQEANERKSHEARRLAREAFEADRHEALNRLELNYFIALSKAQNSTEAAKAVGISNASGNRIFCKLLENHLILHDEQEHTYSIIPEYHEKLEKISAEHATVPLLGSPAVKKLYRMLKAENMYVFPEVPVCAFVSRASVEHLLTTKWKADYYLMCRVDFLICDTDTRPKIAVEYNGSYHREEQQSYRDEFKRELLEAAGLPLQVYTASDLKGGNDEPIS